MLKRELDFSPDPAGCYCISGPFDRLVVRHFMLITGLFLVLYLAWTVYNSLRLHRWLQSWDSKPPESIGMWADIFDRIAALQKQNIKRNLQYQQVIDDFEGLADAFPDATLVINDQGLIRWFNDSAVKLLGLQPDR